MGVAPPPVYGACTSIVPREFGGNMDLKELTAGTTLYLPVLAPGALFSCGDGHGVQGDGEVCVTALETALSRHLPADGAQGSANSTCRAPRRRRTTSRWRSTRTSTTPPRTRCAQMIKLIGERMGLDAADAYMFCSLAVDMRVTQLVDGNKGIHAMLPKHCVNGGNAATSGGAN